MHNASESYAEPFVWTGYGVSGSVAMSAAADSRGRGLVSWFEEPSDIDPRTKGTVILVSQSGKAHLAVQPDLVVSDQTDLSVHTIRVARSPSAWVPLDFAENATLSIREWLGLCTPPPLPRILPATGDMLVFGKSSSSSAALVQAVHSKLRQQPFAVCDASALGHGPHSRFVTREAGEQIWLIACEEPWRTHIREWSKIVNISAIDVSVDNNGILSASTVFLATCNALRAWADALELDLEASRIERRFDGLRHPMG